MIRRLLAVLGASVFAPAIWAGEALTGEVQKQPLNIPAILMFVVFVGATLCITYWASKRNNSAADYYAAGGKITGFQNGLAIAGDYMSAASFLGISALVYTSGYDGLIYSIGFLVGWPIILFLIAERLRNLGKYTFADVASYRLGQTQIRSLSACGSLVVVAFYLIAQMVGAGKLIQLLFGLDYHVAVIMVGVLLCLYVLFGGMLATTWVQIIKAVLLLSGATFMAVMARPPCKRMGREYHGSGRKQRKNVPAWGAFLIEENQWLAGADLPVFKNAGRADARRHTTVRARFPPGRARGASLALSQ